MSQLQENQLFANRYRLLKRLGSGAFSEVWKAEDVEAGNLVVAIKIYAPDKGMDEDGVKIFSQEFAIVFNVSHQNLLRPNYFDKNNGSPFLVLPFCENGSALKLIGNNPTEEEVVRFLHDVSAGLAYLHKQNPPIIHQDIKPDNILIDSNGDYKLTDFGISTRIRSTLRRSVGNAHSAGTMAYMAPERFGEHNQPVKASDIWSLGATVYEIMCEDAPFGNLGGGMQKGGAEIPYISGNYSSELKQVVISCLSKETWNRPKAEQLRKITEQYLESGKWKLDAITEKAENSPSTPSSGRPTERKTQPFTSASEKPSGTPEPFSPDLPQPPKKKSLVWLWILLAVLVVGGGIWAIVDADSRIETEGEKLMYEHCTTLSDYRAYVGKYPSGVYVELAKNKINTLVADSTAEENRKTQEKAEQQRIAEENRKTQEKAEQQRIAEENRKAQEKAEQQRIAEENRKKQEIAALNVEVVYVQGGTFTMGCTFEQGSDCYSDETPSHRVTVSSFYIGKYEVTQKLWEAVMGNNPSGFKGGNLPVENVSWDNCQEFILKLNSKTGKTFRLPTEAEWEYAARGGNKSNGYKYSGSNTLRDVAWFGQCNGNTYDNGNSGEKTHSVGSKSPNELGIYDMSGNVWEWCSDWYGSYSSGSQTNPTGPSSGSYRVLRGGSWHYYARNCRVSIRYYINPDYRINNCGFRLILVQ